MYPADTFVSGNAHPWHINRFARRPKSDFALISVAQLYAGRNRMQLQLHRLCAKPNLNFNPN